MWCESGETTTRAPGTWREKQITKTRRVGATHRVFSHADRQNDPLVNAKKCRTPCRRLGLLFLRGSQSESGVRRFRGFFPGPLIFTRAEPWNEGLKSHAHHDDLAGPESLIFVGGVAAWRARVMGGHGRTPERRIVRTPTRGVARANAPDARGDDERPSPPSRGDHGARADADRDPLDRPWTRPMTKQKFGFWRPSRGGRRSDAMSGRPPTSGLKV